MKRLVIPAVFGLLVITAAWGELEQQEWLQWAQNPQHTGFIGVQGQAPEKQLADIVYDPFVAQEQTEENGELLVHYQVPLINQKHVYMEFKTGVWVPCPTPGSWIFGDACGPNTWNQEIWNEKALVAGSCKRTGPFKATGNRSRLARRFLAPAGCRAGSRCSTR